MGSSLSWQTDTQLHDPVQRQFEWDPEAESHDIALTNGISNQIAVKPNVSVSRVKADIDAALHRCADVDATHVRVSVDGAAVTLSGQVSSCYEQQEAERAAWAAPGVVRVENRLTVGLPRETRDALARPAWR